MAVPIRVEHLNAAFGPFQALHDVTLTLPARQVTAILGPSGCGKSTFVRCINRMHEETPGGRVWGQIYLGDEPVYGPDVDPVVIRRRVGMVFQRPTPFPTMSILENVVAGPTHSLSRPNHTPSSSFSGGVQIPPISPVMCQPLA